MIPRLLFQVGTSTFATNIGAQTFIGLSGSAAAGGIAVVMYEWNVRQSGLCVVKCSCIIIGWRCLLT